MYLTCITVEGTPAPVSHSPCEACVNPFRARPACATSGSVARAVATMRKFWWASSPRHDAELWRRMHLDSAFTIGAVRDAAEWAAGWAL